MGHNCSALSKHVHLHSHYCMDLSILKSLDPTAYYSKQNSCWEVDAPCSRIKELTFYQLCATEKGNRMQALHTNGMQKGQSMEITQLLSDLTNQSPMQSKSMTTKGWPDHFCTRTNYLYAIVIYRTAGNFQKGQIFKYFRNCLSVRKFDHQKFITQPLMSIYFWAWAT